MKAIMAVWLLSAGIGLSYSVISERKHRVKLLHVMEKDLKQFCYYMCEWRMPMEEVLRQMIKEAGLLRYFYSNILEKIRKKQISDLGTIWYEESRNMWTEIGALAEASALWEECFFHMPADSEGMKRHLELKSEAIEAKRIEVEEKYKGEQRLVFSMGFFVGAFLCLILW